MVLVAWVTAHGVRHDFVLHAAPSSVWSLALPLLLSEALIFRLTGLYRGLWYFSSLPDLVRIAKGVAISSLVPPALWALTRGWDAASLSVAIAYPLFLLVFMAGGRFAYRAWKEHRLVGELGAGRRPVLILGAGRGGANLAKALHHSPEWRVMGFLDDDPAKRDREIQGLRVWGTIAELPTAASRLGVAHAILAVPSADDATRQRLIKVCMDAGVRAYTVPPIDQLLSGQERLEHLRPLALDDLLGRPTVAIDTAPVRELISQRVVMVTGAGGSIGAELVRQIARFEPAQLVLFELNEFALYTIHEELTQRFPHLTTLALAGDVKDAAWVGYILQQYQPAVIFHAAAYKHVPLMENHNAWQAIRNNVLGTYVLARAAIRAGAKKFVLVSTDKAVNPASVMGASKRMAEMVCQALQKDEPATRFEIVRFGNVLGSTGSVIPKFAAQIRQGGPVTVTHPEMTRYFMSLNEAAQLVLQAAALGKGGEIFVLDMGEPIKIVDLARRMIQLAGRNEQEVRIVYTGLRPGEKLHEEVLAVGEETRPTHHPKVRVARARPVDHAWLSKVVEWLRGPPRTEVEARRDLRRFVPEYNPATLPELRIVHRNEAGH
ncbi:MAG: polysaccharide biosynthesis protein [Rhodocyclaceae bacterium]|nr:polysaccharide biosynthesis protein [Rhodocyclaceae bacterium]